MAHLQLKHSWGTAPPSSPCPSADHPLPLHRPSLLLPPAAGVSRLTGKLAPEARNFTALARLKLFENLIFGELPSLARLGAAGPPAPRRQPTSAAIWIGDRRHLLLQSAAATASSVSLLPPPPPSVW
ncbi:hypothetical protein E2562_015069 [Oryza meyeriana var. granulata]|uniref:Uncharacterized protein n=1 Tax=Oryza meyeriana var. granulata TaxID=110450 RepID=A0A6G1DXF7_9ORYZ|nr:hypothetical protein E2562_015069 [Oryza meyeriana var. granulata]